MPFFDWSATVPVAAVASETLALQSEDPPNLMIADSFAY